MKTTKLILKDAKKILAEKEQLTDIQSEHFVDRYFSTLYKIYGKSHGHDQAYILKISTTNRSCENEYEQYTYLNDLNINSLTPIHYSKKYNYLITEQKDMTEFSSYLKEHRTKKIRVHSFLRLGSLLKEVEQKTGKNSTFDRQEYEGYVIPRLERNKYFSKKELDSVKNKVRYLTSTINKSKIRECFVSDFTLGNIHIDNNGGFVIVDMGDAYTGNQYDNIAYIYLNIRFGPLNQYIGNNTKTNLYFTNFLKGYGITTINQIEFSLFQLKHLANMISFIDSLILESKSDNSLKSKISYIANRYLIQKYKKYFLSLISNCYKDAIQNQA